MKDTNIFGNKVEPTDEELEAFENKVIALSGWFADVFQAKDIHPNDAARLMPAIYVKMMASFVAIDCIDLKMAMGATELLPSVMKGMAEFKSERLKEMAN